MTTPATSVSANRASQENLLVPVATLVVWVGCAAVGALGWALPYARARLAIKPEPPPVTAQVIPVKLAVVPTTPTPTAPTAPALVAPPALPRTPALPEAPPLIVAAPSPQIAFAVPVAAPARLGTAAEATYRTPEPAVVPTVAPTDAAPAPQPLTFGVGEGRQALPEYPRDARRLGQEGTVKVQLTVGENGRVLAAEVTEPCPWPLLNSAALRTIRQRWQFAAGPVRLFEVAIRFQLNK